jgi:AraC-like DNA-binding protein
MAPLAGGGYRATSTDTDEPATEVDTRLGFSEATNFTKSFVRLSGSTPGDFRQASRGTRPDSTHDEVAVL